MRPRYNGVGELARTELTRPDNCTNAVFTIAIDDFVFTPVGRALHVRTANTAAVSVDYIWLDDLPVAQFQDSYDTQGVYIGTEANEFTAFPARQQQSGAGRVAVTLWKKPPTSNPTGSSPSAAAGLAGTGSQLKFGRRTCCTVTTGRCIKPPETSTMANVTGRSGQMAASRKSSDDSARAVQKKSSAAPAGPGAAGRRAD